MPRRAVHKRNFLSGVVVQKTTKVNLRIADYLRIKVTRSAFIGSYLISLRLNAEMAHVRPHCHATGRDRPL